MIARVQKQPPSLPFQSAESRQGNRNALSEKRGADKILADQHSHPFSLASANRVLSGRRLPKGGSANTLPNKSDILRKQRRASSPPMSPRDSRFQKGIPRNAPSTSACARKAIKRRAWEFPFISLSRDRSLSRDPFVAPGVNEILSRKASQEKEARALASAVWRWKEFERREKRLRYLAAQC
ncbi:hypothetical protein NPIL_548021 [Nephila pilipes]|uniref:Uncharacterized protein n=1 Tax=Nephila pilipes TaxID=299642 RepID=A0A8X6PQU7_NEPPI|nr:hypothetical protein NPIL_548021 [Nephila pilipes]